VKIKKCIDYISSDLYRYEGIVSLKIFIKYYLFNPGFKVSFWFRIASFFQNPLTKFIHYRACFKYHIEIPIGCNIGYGLYIGHGIGGGYCFE